MKKNNSIIIFSFILIFVVLACNLPGVAVDQTAEPVPATATEDTACGFCFCHSSGSGYCDNISFAHT